jgi:hypothetical protein
MKKLKLEVGKTYRSRNGKRVEIVENDGKDRYPFRGDNDEWYAESGRWHDFDEEDPEDLIEEVPETRHAFEIPDGVKRVTVEQVGNRIVVEMVPEEVGPKPGNVMIDAKGNVYIFKAAVDNFNHKHFAWFGKDGRLVIGSMCTPGRPATLKEAKPLFDALKKAGKRWNAETMQVEEIPEKEQIEEFLKRYADGVIWSHEQLRWLIEDYLKHKEGEK